MTHDTAVDTLAGMETTWTLGQYTIRAFPSPTKNKSTIAIERTGFVRQPFWGIGASANRRKPRTLTHLPSGLSVASASDDAQLAALAQRIEGAVDADSLAAQQPWISEGWPAWQAVMREAASLDMDHSEGWTSPEQVAAREGKCPAS